MFDIISPLDKVTSEFVRSIQDKLDLKCKPQGSLGLLESIAFKVALLQQTLTPQLIKPSVIIFAADHGVADEGVSLFPQVVTEQMVLNFLANGAAINCFSNQHNIDLKIVNSGVKANFDNITDANFINDIADLVKESLLEKPNQSLTEACIRNNCDLRDVKDLIPIEGTQIKGSSMGKIIDFAKHAPSKSKKMLQKGILKVLGL